MLTQVDLLLRKTSRSLRLVSVEHPRGIAEQLVIAPGGGRTTALAIAKLLAPTMLQRELLSFDLVVESQAAEFLWPPYSIELGYTVLRVVAPYHVETLLLDHPADHPDQFVAAVVALLSELGRGHKK